VALQAHDRAGSAAAALRAVEQFRRGGDPRRRIGALSTAICITSLPAAVKATLLEEMRSLCAAGGPTHLRVALRSCEAEVARARGDLQAARAAALEAIDASPPGPFRAETCRHVAAMELELGRVGDALLHAREAERLMEPGGVSGLLYVLPTLIGSLIAAQELDAARVTLAHALALSRRAGWWRLTDIARRGALLAAAEGRSGDAKVVLGWLSLHSPVDPLTDPVEAAAQSRAESALEPFKATLLTPDPPDEAMLCECMLRLCPR
jgi:hypothetical protein